MRSPWRRHLLRLSRSVSDKRELFLPVREYLADTATEPEWLWQELLAPGSITLLAGKPKVGKSTLVYGVLGALAAGSPFVGRATRRTGALILSEEPREAIAAKVARFGGHEHHIADRAALRALPWADQLSQAGGYARANDLGLVVVDTFADLAGLRGEEENDAGAVLGALDPIKREAEQGDLAVLLVHHQRKSGGSHGDGVRGSGAFTGGVDIVAELRRPGEGTADRTLWFVSRYSPETSVAVALTPDGYVEKLSPEDQDIARILLDLDAMGAASTTDLHEATEIPLATLKRRLSKMHEELGLIEPVDGTGRGNSPTIWKRAT